MSELSLYPGKAWRAFSAIPEAEQLPEGLDAYWDKAAGFIKHIKPRKRLFIRRAKQIMILAPVYLDLSDDELKIKAAEMREIFLLGRETNDDIHHAFALIREISGRCMGMKHYMVQLAGGLAIESGCIAEMSTGEGKTLTATLPAVLAGWRGQGCHLMTSNSYLATRDAEEMEPIYSFCGLTVAALGEDTQDDADRRQAYLADITYCTNQDAAADFLRDQLSSSGLQLGAHSLLQKITGISEGNQEPSVPVQRGLACAIIDEADSVLVEDSITPLLISGESPNPEQILVYQQSAEVLDRFVEGDDYNVDWRFKDIKLTNSGYEKLNAIQKEFGGIWSGQVRSREFINQALQARHFFLKDKQYIIDEEKVVIVDESTGRLMPDRFWQSGMHQAVEAKEKTEITPPKDTFARISFQKFFRFYDRLSGMTGTAMESKKEFWQIYRSPSVVIPTNEKCIRKSRRNQIYKTAESKWDAVVNEIVAVHSTGRPILIGTGSIKDSELLSERLIELDYEHQVLNASKHREEAEIVAVAGHVDKITVSTNMAGRGTDIKLSEKARELGGLHVIATERMHSKSIDRQLYGRSSRQGDPGTAIAYVALDDELAKRYSKFLVVTLKFVFPPFFKRIHNPLYHLIFWICQKNAMRIARMQRTQVLKSDNWLEDSLGFTGDGN
ncbi:MAG: hypothetical protein HRT89_09825 [Lentisphaeria bacterium]|nr:hypothetical protein [Lentisphaeria bacterium]NQZ68358.1 hypothetical protein [Lentisphaeria bacterium]